MPKLKLKRLRRWATTVLAMPKRCKDARNSDRYTFDSDDERDKAAHPATVEMDRHRHVDFGTTGHRPSKVTSFHNVPRVASTSSKRARARASSAPPPLRAGSVEPLLDTFVDGVDHSYVLNEPLTFEPETEDESEYAARVRTAGVRHMLISSSLC